MFALSSRSVDALRTPPPLQRANARKLLLSAVRAARTELAAAAAAAFLIRLSVPSGSLFRGPYRIELSGSIDRQARLSIYLSIEFITPTATHYFISVAKANERKATLGHKNARLILSSTNLESSRNNREIILLPFKKLNKTKARDLIFRPTFNHQDDHSQLPLTAYEKSSGRDNVVFWWYYLSPLLLSIGIAIPKQSQLIYLHLTSISFYLSLSLFPTVSLSRSAVSLKL